MPVEIKIGEFVRNHLEKIVDYCENNTIEIDNLMSHLQIQPSSQANIF